MKVSKTYTEKEAKQMIDDFKAQAVCVLEGKGYGVTVDDFSMWTRGPYVYAKFGIDYVAPKYAGWHYTPREGDYYPYIKMTVNNRQTTYTKLNLKNFISKFEGEINAAKERIRRNKVIEDKNAKRQEYFEKVRVIWGDEKGSYFSLRIGGEVRPYSGDKVEVKVNVTEEELSVLYEAIKLSRTLERKTL